MSNGWPKKPGRKKAPRIQPHEIRGAKYLRNILDLLERLRPHHDCANRLLHYDEYVAYLLLYFFTPVLTSVRGLQQASDFRVIHRKLGLPRFSLGSFSEASRVFDPTLLQPLMEEIVRQLTPLEGHPRLGALDLALTAVDGTLLRALPKMLWALWLSPEQRATKMHLEFDILKGAPVHAAITDANANERTVLREHLAADLIAEIYRSRWQIEIFFRWFKKILHADQLLSLSQNGLTLVAYVALLASLLVTLWTGRKPTKRTYEMICFYFLGWVAEDELVAHLEKLELADA